MKYTEEQKQQIHNLSSNGWSSRRIAKYLGISKSGVNMYHPPMVSLEGLSNITEFSSIE